MNGPDLVCFAVGAGALAVAGLLWLAYLAAVML